MLRTYSVKHLTQLTVYQRMELSIAHSAKKISATSTLVIIDQTFDQGETFMTLVGIGLFFHNRGYRILLHTHHEPETIQRLLPLLPPITQEIIAGTPPTATIEDRNSMLITTETIDLERLPYPWKKIAEQANRLQRVILFNTQNRSFSATFPLSPHLTTRHATLSEQCLALCSHIDNAGITDHIATALLAGIIIATRSFRSEIVPPEVLSLAGSLIRYGAVREKIIHHLYRTRSVPMLRLWGHALTRLNYHSAGIAFTSLTSEDFRTTQTTPIDIHGIMDELLTTSKHAPLVVLLYQYDKNQPVQGVLCSTRQDISCTTLTQSIGGRGSSHSSSFILKHTSLTLAQEYLLTLLSGLLPTQAADRSYPEGVPNP